MSPELGPIKSVPPSRTATLVCSSCKASLQVSIPSAPPSTATPAKTIDSVDVSCWKCHAVNAVSLAEFEDLSTLFKRNRGKKDEAKDGKEKPRGGRSTEGIFGKEGSGKQLTFYTHTHKCSLSLSPLAPPLSFALSFSHRAGAFCAPLPYLYD